MSGYKRLRQVRPRRYKRLFIIATEGAITEPEYFRNFRNTKTSVDVQCLPSKHASAPTRILKRMMGYIAAKGLRGTDRAWLVCDTDQWPAIHLQRLNKWSKSDARYGFAVSNPNFEYWLLLHFEDPSGVSTKDQVLRKLRRHLAGYDKCLQAKDFTEVNIQQACSRAEKRERSNSVDWPDKHPGSTVYKLVQSLLQGA